MDLVEPGPVLPVEGLGHLLDGLVHVIAYEMDIQSFARAYHVFHWKVVQGFEVSCHPGVLLRGQAKMIVQFCGVCHAVHSMAKHVDVKEQSLDDRWAPTLY